MSQPADPQSESEILRRHMFYQKSYIQDVTLPRPQSCRYPPKPVSMSSNLTRSRKKAISIDRTPMKKQQVESPVRQAVRTSIEQLEHRRLQRADRERPWREETSKSKPKTGTIQLYYDRTLPSSIDKSKVTFRARKFVSNTKYGNFYEIREVPKTKQLKPPPTQRWIWEDEFMLWMSGTRQYIDEPGAPKNKLSSSGSKPSIGMLSATFTPTPSSGNLPFSQKVDHPNNVYE